MTQSPPCTQTVTVAIPVYNGEAYVGQAIESVLAQTRSSHRDPCIRQCFHGRHPGDRP